MLLGFVIATLLFNLGSALQCFNGFQGATKEQTCTDLCGIIFSDDGKNESRVFACLPAAACAELVATCCNSPSCNSPQSDAQSPSKGIYRRGGIVPSSQNGVDSIVLYSAATWLVFWQEDGAIQFSTSASLPLSWSTPPKPVVSGSTTDKYVQVAGASLNDFFYYSNSRPTSNFVALWSRFAQNTSKVFFSSGQKLSTGSVQWASPSQLGDNFDYDSLSAPALASNGMFWMATWVSSSGSYFDCKFVGAPAPVNGTESPVVIPNGTHVLVVSTSENGTTWSQPCALFPSATTLDNTTTNLILTSKPKLLWANNRWTISWLGQSNKLLVFNAYYPDYLWSQSPNIHVNATSSNNSFPVDVAYTAGRDKYLGAFIDSTNPKSMIHYLETISSVIGNTTNLEATEEMEIVRNGLIRVTWGGVSSSVPPPRLPTVPFTLLEDKSVVTAFISSTPVPPVLITKGYNNDLYWVVAWVEKFVAEDSTNSSITLYQIFASLSQDDGATWLPPKAVLGPEHVSNSQQSGDDSRYTSYSKLPWVVNSIASATDPTTQLSDPAHFVITASSGSNVIWSEVDFTPPPPGECINGGTYDNFFVCINKTFVYDGDISIDSDYILGPFKYVLKGNLTVGGQLTLNGSLLEVTGAVTIGKSINVIVLSDYNDNYSNKTTFGWISASCLTILSPDLPVTIVVQGITSTTTATFKDTNYTYNIITTTTTVNSSACFTPSELKNVPVRVISGCPGGLRGTTAVTANSLQITFTDLPCSTGSPPSSNGGTIAGIVIGCVVGLTVLALAIILLPKLCSGGNQNIDVSRYGE